MWFFERESNEQKLVNSANRLIEMNKSLIALSNSHNDKAVATEIADIAEEIKYLANSYLDNVNKIDKKIENAIMDLKQYMNSKNIVRQQRAITEMKKLLIERNGLV